MKSYMTIPEAAVKWGVSAQQVRSGCEKPVSAVWYG